jgi:ATP-dependent DNA ligase
LLSRTAISSSTETDAPSFCGQGQVGDRVEPNFVAEITYLTWTADTLLRHTVYVGLREDKPAIDVKRDWTPPSLGSPPSPKLSPGPARLQSRNAYTTIMVI